MTAAEKQRRRRPAAATAAVGIRLIRKYGNRRLYDTHTSRYVTLGDLLEVFSGAEEVQVIDATNGEDLTKRVLAQVILFEEARRGTQIVPTQLLRAMLRLRKEVSRELYERRMQRLIGEAGGTARPGTMRAGESDAAPPQPARELDDLKRRLKALETQIVRKK